MAIFLNNDSKVIVQGMTGSEGMKHTTRMLASGTNVVGGVNPRKAGTTVDFPEGKQVPVFGSVADAMKETGADVSVVFVPPAFAKSAVIEAIDAEIGLAVVITEGIPVKDTAEFYNYSKDKATRIIGPNCPGIISPGKSNAGIIPADIAGTGRIGLVSKSGTLTYQMMYELRDFGFSTAIGIGGDPIIGTTHIDALEAFQRLKTTLADDLGIDPGPTVRTLYERILRQEPLNVRQAAQTTAVHKINSLDMRTAVDVQATPAHVRALSGRVYPLVAAATRIGRLPDNDIVLDNANVSRHHAVIIDTGTSFVITDLRSANGVDVNGERIRGTASLNDGDRFRICDHQFVFEIVRPG